MNKIKIDVKQASQFMEAGYEIECYVLVPRILQKAVKRTINAVIPADAKLRVSIDAEGPSKGAYQVVWTRLKKKLWVNGDITEHHTRSEIETALKSIEPKLDPGFFVYLVNNKKCLKVVE